MYTAADLLRSKPNVLHSITADASALDAARRMNEHQIGSLVVLDRARLVGIVTERDILRRVVAAERPPMTTRVRDIMTPDPVTCECSTGLAELRELMRDRRIRHVPVLAGGVPAGMISIGDLNAAELKVLGQTVAYLEGYICG